MDNIDGNNCLISVVIKPKKLKSWFESFKYLQIVS